MALLEFYGIECPHCKTMDPLVDKLEKELKIKLQRLEVWHNDANRQKMESIDKGKCGGVPFFFNEKTKATICGAVSYNVLKKWATS